LGGYGDGDERSDFRFEVGLLHVLAERVARNDLDMAVIAGGLPSSELQARSVAQDELTLIAPPMSALARARSLKPSQLESETWLLREEGSDTRRQLATWWHRPR